MTIREVSDRIGADDVIETGLTRRCGWPDCTASYQADTGPAGDPGWRRPHVGGVICPVHSALNHFPGYRVVKMGRRCEQDTLEPPACLGACTCGAATSRPVPTAGRIVEWWQSHAREVAARNGGTS